jgi:hypothetical protein
MGFEERKKGSAPKKEHNFLSEINETLLRFQAIFELIQNTKNQKTKKYYFDSLDKELNLLDELVKSVDKKGVRKIETDFSKAAKAYIEDQSTENFDILRQYITTLKEANTFPKNINQ